MMAVIGVIGALLLLVALLGLLLGLIKPSLVIWWGANRTRGKVILTYGLVFIVSIAFTVIGAPSDIDAGRTALTEKDYKTAVAHLEAVTPSDAGYSEAQRLLPEARKNLYLSNLEAAEVASSAGDHAKVVALLSDYPTDGAGSIDAAKILAESKDALAEAERDRIALEEQQRAQQKAENARREEQERMEAAARKQKRAMADFPECASDEAELEIARTMEGAPLGRVFGLSIIKISDARQVAASGMSRNCEGIAQLNNAQSYPLTYRFYRDGEDIMIEAEVHGLE